MTEKKREWSELELDPGHGVLFKTSFDNPKAPEFKGSIEIPANLTGRLDISLWSYTSKAGKVFLKVIVQEPYKKDGDDERPARGGATFRASSAASTRSAPSAPKDDFDDDIPF